MGSISRGWRGASDLATMVAVFLTGWRVHGVTRSGAIWIGGGVLESKFQAAGPRRTVINPVRLPKAVDAGGWQPVRALVWLVMLAGLWGGAPASAGPAAAPARRAPVYFPVTLDEAGGISKDALNHISGAVEPEAGVSGAQLVVLVHGYNTSQTLGRRQYRQIARDLVAEGEKEGWHPVVIGVHWPSHPGPLLHWLPQMLGYRFISGTGFPNALTNPYLDKARLAASAGRTGLRALLFRLQDDFPGVPLHVFAHSMGSELLIRALAPGPELPPPLLTPIEQPERVLRIQMAVLAGADLDQDVFSPREEHGVPEALPRAAVWWITVPRKNSADAALELRRSAGRRDAMGNVGLELERAQFAALIERRGLVIDNRSVPITHDIRAYYTRERLRDLTASLLYLRQPTAPAPRHSVLADLDTVLAAVAAGQEASPSPGVSASVRLYLRWQHDRTRQDFGPVRIGTTADAGRLRPGEHRH